MFEIVIFEFGKSVAVPDSSDVSARTCFAPTRLLDTPTGEELRVDPAPGRLLLMDQDITHSVTRPHAAAGDRPRYSLVLKLVLHPPASGESAARVQLADPAWGEPAAFGSAALPTT